MAVPDIELHNPALDRMRVQCKAGPLVKYLVVQPDSEAPVKATREVSFQFPSALLEHMHEPKAKGFDRGESMRTNRGLERKRCALVILFIARRLKQAPTFQILRDHGTHFIQHHQGLSTKFGHLNLVEQVGSYLKGAHKAHSDLVQRNQPSNLYWLKDDWLVELGTDATAVWYIDNGQLSVNLFVLAVSQDIRSELEDPITHIMGFEGHAYEMAWEDGMETLGETLSVLPKLNRYCDVGIDLCVRFEDTGS